MSPGNMPVTTLADLREAVVSVIKQALDTGVYGLVLPHLSTAVVFDNQEPAFEQRERGVQMEYTERSD